MNFVYAPQKMFKILNFKLPILCQLSFKKFYKYTYFDFYKIIMQYKCFFSKYIQTLLRKKMFFGLYQISRLFRVS